MAQELRGWRRKWDGRFGLDPAERPAGSGLPRAVLKGDPCYDLFGFGIWVRHAGPSWGSRTPVVAGLKAPHLIRGEVGYGCVLGITHRLRMTDWDRGAEEDGHDLPGRPGLAARCLGWGELKQPSWTRSVRGTDPMATGPRDRSTSLIRPSHIHIHIHIPTIRRHHYLLLTCPSNLLPIPQSKLPPRRTNVSTLVISHLYSPSSPSPPSA